jgi:hypothetical protein
MALGAWWFVQTQISPPAGDWHNTSNLWVWDGASWRQVIAAWIWSSGSWNQFYDTTPGPLARIVVSPSSVNLTEGQQQQFTALGFDANNRPISVSPTWTINTITDTIDSVTGLFTCGAFSDTCTVNADVGAIDGTATVFAN